MALWRIPRVCEETGLTRSKLYNDIKDGLMPRTVPLSGRTVGLPSDEVQAINRARIGGKSEDEIRALVSALHSARTSQEVVA